jgi:tRNA(Ser,Leu) C12 N-acetylase TAN1
LSFRERLKEITEVFLWCAQDPTEEEVGKQFKYETGVEASREEILDAIKKVVDRANQAAKT